MGNRAVVAFVNDRETSLPKVYLHWNGGIGSVRAFLKYCELRGDRSDDYGVARFCQVVGNFFGGTLSLGCFDANVQGDDSDNGTYFVKNWQIIKRVGHQYRENDEGEWYSVPIELDINEKSEYDLAEMLKDIDDSMPETQRLFKEHTVKEVLEKPELVQNWHF